MISTTRELLIAIDDLAMLSRDFRTGWLPVSDTRILRKQRSERIERQNLRRLAAKRLIKLQRNHEQILVQLTEKGKQECCKARIRLSERKLPDGQLCVVVFDIPESGKKVRRAFRLFLKSCHFRMHQRSVWVSDKDVSDDLMTLVKKLKIRKYVTVYLAKEKS